MAGNAGLIDSSTGCCTKLLCTHLERQLDWCCNLPYYWLLSTARTHPSIWWIQKFLYANPWYLKHPWHHPPVGLSCVVIGTPHLLGIEIMSRRESFSTSEDNFLQYFTFLWKISSCLWLYSMVIAFPFVLIFFGVTNSSNNLWQTEEDRTLGKHHCKVNAYCHQSVLPIWVDKEKKSVASWIWAFT